MNRRCGPSAGFTLVELLVAMALAALLITGVLRLALAATSGFRLQQGLGQVSEDLRFALGVVAGEVRAAGFDPAPWARTVSPGLATGTMDRFSAHSDRLVVQRLSRADCHDLPNPDLDTNGLPAWGLRESSFYRNTTGGLAWRCRYGPPNGALVTQLNGLTLLTGLEHFQLEFAVLADGTPEWRPADGSLDLATVRAVRIGLLVATEQPVGAASGGPILLLDRAVAGSDDGRLVQVAETVVALRGPAP